MPGFLIHDRDSNYGDAVGRCCKLIGLQDILTAYRSPWQNAFVEGVIGSIRPEYLDYTIVMGERYCRQLLTTYARYHNEVRPHQSLGGHSPVPRWVRTPSVGRVVAVPGSGGLHHRYQRAAWAALRPVSQAQGEDSLLASSGQVATKGRDAAQVEARPAQDEVLGRDSPSLSVATPLASG